MKRFLALVVIVVAAAIAVPVALAWHAVDAVVAVACNAGVYNVSASVVQSAQYPGGVVKSVTPSVFPGNTTGTKQVVVLVGWPNSKDTQPFTKSVTLTGNCVVPTGPVCPPDTVRDASSTSTVLVCVRTQTVTNYVNVPVQVPGPTVTVPGPTVTKTVIKKSKPIVKWKTKTKVKTVVVTHTVVKRPICKFPGVHKNGVEGSG